jgi:hypothetical protein
MRVDAILTVPAPFRQGFERQPAITKTAPNLFVCVLIDVYPAAATAGSDLSPIDYESASNTIAASSVRWHILRQTISR